MIRKFRRASLTLLLLFTLPTSAASSNAEVLEAINKTCVPSEEMVVAGIRLGDARTLVESRLGAASRRKVEGPGEVLEYEGLRIRLHASRVQSVVATTSERSTASGIHPGISADEAGAILGFDLNSIESPHSKSPGHYQIHRCIAPHEQIDVEQYLRLELSAHRVIAAIEIFWVSP
jgi:hypothetical protein